MRERLFLLRKTAIHTYKSCATHVKYDMQNMQVVYPRVLAQSRIYTNLSLKKRSISPQVMWGEKTLPGFGKGTNTSSCSLLYACMREHTLVKEDVMDPSSLKEYLQSPQPAFQAFCCCFCCYYCPCWNFPCSFRLPSGASPLVCSVTQDYREK